MLQTVYFSCMLQSRIPNLCELSYFFLYQEQLSILIFYNFHLPVKISRILLECVYMYEWVVKGKKKEKKKLIVLLVYCKVMTFFFILYIFFLNFEMTPIVFLDQLLFLLFYLILITMFNYHDNFIFFIEN